MDTLQDKKQKQNPQSLNHKWQWIFCSCLLQPHLTRCCRCLSSGYYEFTSYTIGHPGSSHYARNMEILQRRTSCGPGNAKGTLESFCHCKPILPHIPSSTQQSEMEQDQYSQPFIPCHFFSVSGIQCPDYIYTGAAQSWPMLINSFVWSPDLPVLWQSE